MTEEMVEYHFTAEEAFDTHLALIAAIQAGPLPGGGQVSNHPSPAYINQMTHGLRRADTYWVNSDMTYLVEQSADELLKQTVLESADVPITSPPTQNGFCIFETALPFKPYPPEVARFPMSLIGLSWIKRPRCPDWLDTSGPQGYSQFETAEVRKSEGFVLNLVLLAPMGDQEVISLGHTLWLEWRSLGEVVTLRAGDHADARILLALVCALWQICHDRITGAEYVPHTSREHKKAEKRFEREPGVLWLTLRHAKGAKDVAGGHQNGGGDGREYSCRWLVRGHWRKLASGKLTWVKPYVKGPEDKPLRIRETGVKLVR